MIKKETELKRKDLIKKIRAYAPSWMLADMDAAVEERNCIEWWGDEETFQANQGWDEIDWLEDVSTQDHARTSQFKNAIRKIDKGIGILVQVKEGEEIQTLAGCMKVGQWRYTGTYDSLIRHSTV